MRPCSSQMTRTSSSGVSRRNPAASLRCRTISSCTTGTRTAMACEKGTSATPSASPSKACSPGMKVSGSYAGSSSRRSASAHRFLGTAGASSECSPAPRASVADCAAFARPLFILGLLFFVFFGSVAPATVTSSSSSGRRVSSSATRFPAALIPASIMSKNQLEPSSANDSGFRRRASSRGVSPFLPATMPHTIFASSTCSRLNS
mmetsp:Transcript_30729/g.98263  ORF Transcript_30729/g.98263 Transcript_30729/m.98263 type:complete len:205 (-) Transcript_30729:394-1008(-)